MTTSSGRIAVVTGANKGIGYHIAHQLGTSGLFTKVVLGCRDETRGHSAATKLNETLQGSNVSFEYHPLTIGDVASHSAFCQSMEGKYGKVDVVVNNAGILYRRSDPTPFTEQTRSMMAINYYGLVDFTEQIMPLLRKGEDSRLVNVASTRGWLGQVSPNLQKKFTSATLTIPEVSALTKSFEEAVNDGNHIELGWGDDSYGISKLAVIAATKVWAREEAGNVSAMSCHPGWCATDMTAYKGPVPAEDGARNAVIPATMTNPPTGAYFSEYNVATW